MCSQVLLELIRGSHLVLFVHLKSYSKAIPKVLKKTPAMEFILSKIARPSRATLQKRDSTAGVFQLFYRTPVNYSFYNELTLNIFFNETVIFEQNKILLEWKIRLSTSSFRGGEEITCKIASRVMMILVELCTTKERVHKSANSEER